MSSRRGDNKLPVAGGITCTSSVASEAADAFTLWLAGLAVADRRRVAAWLLDMCLQLRRAWEIGQH